MTTPQGSFVILLKKPNASGQALRLETSGELVVGRAKVFGQEACFADRGHEIVASHPTRQNVQVKVVSNAGPRGLTEVHPPIVPAGMVNRFQSGLVGLR